MAEKKRRVIQITGIQETIAAVCDDGSVWLLSIPVYSDGFGERRWVQAPEIPQPRSASVKAVA